METTAHLILVWIVGSLAIVVWLWFIVELGHNFKDRRDRLARQARVMAKAVHRLNIKV